MIRQSSKRFPHTNTLNPSQSAGGRAAEGAEGRVGPADAEPQGSEQRELSRPRWAAIGKESRLRPRQSCHQAARYDTNQIMPCPCSPSRLSEGGAVMPSTISPWRKVRPLIRASREPFSGPSAASSLLQGVCEAETGRPHNERAKQDPHRGPRLRHHRPLPHPTSCFSPPKRIIVTQGNHRG